MQFAPHALALFFANNYLLYRVRVCVCVRVFKYLPQHVKKQNAQKQREMCEHTLSIMLKAAKKTGGKKTLRT